MFLVCLARRAHRLHRCLRCMLWHSLRTCSRDPRPTCCWALSTPRAAGGSPGPAVPAAREFSELVADSCYVIQAMRLSAPLAGICGPACSSSCIILETFPPADNPSRSNRDANRQEGSSQAKLLEKGWKPLAGIQSSGCGNSAARIAANAMSPLPTRALIQSRQAHQVLCDGGKLLQLRHRIPWNEG